MTDETPDTIWAWRPEILHHLDLSASSHEHKPPAIEYIRKNIYDKRITELERQNADLQANNTKLLLESRELKKPASRWKALVACERLRLLGRAGFDDNDKSGYRHFGMEFWTEWGGSIFDNSLEIETLEKYADCLIESEVSDE